MHSKLPVRIKKKEDERKCCCSELFQIMLQNSGDTSCKFCLRKEASLEKFSSRSRTTQTDFKENFSEAKSFGEIKAILLSINETLDEILLTLKEKKDVLYSKLQEEGVTRNKSKLFFNKNKYKKKNNQVVKKNVCAWPDISRLCIGQPSWLQNLTFEIPQSDNNLIIYPRHFHWTCGNRPNSCPNINYFQPMGRNLSQKNSLNFPIFSTSIFRLISQVDLEGLSDSKSLEEHEIDDTSVEEEIK